jgi:hypothetical protein
MGHFKNTAHLNATHTNQKIQSYSFVGDNCIDWNWSNLFDLPFLNYKKPRAVLGPQPEPKATVSKKP